MRATLQHCFAPLALEIVDQSASHAGHIESGGKGETHFFVKVVSSVFEGVRPVDRQREIYAALAEELKNGLHALDLRALTPTEAQSVR